MKKKLISMICILGVTSSLLAGCAVAAPAPTEPEAEPAQEETVEEAEEAEKEEEGMVGIANPWVEITEEEAVSYCNRLFKAPEGAKDVTWRMLEGSEKESVVGKPLVQLSFMYGDPELSYTARAQEGASEDADIAGNYVKWTVEDETTLANWGEGHMPAKFSRSINDSGMVDQISWYDIEIGILYTLSTSAEDLEGFDIRAIAEQMYAPENEPLADAPENDEMSYVSPDGWTVSYDPELFECNEIDEHSAQFTFLGEAAGACLVSVSYIEGEEPEAYLDEYTADWGEDTTAIEGILPGTKDTPGFFRMTPDEEEGSGLQETAIAGAYKDGILFIDVLSHRSGDEEQDMYVSDMLANVVDSVRVEDLAD